MGRFKKLLGDPEGKKLKQYTKRVKSINALTDDYDSKSQKDLRSEIDDIKTEVREGKTIVDKQLEKVFAITRAMSSHVLKMRHFDVQLVGGMALHEGNVAEMRTGEGKTLVATLPVTLNALEGKGVHVVTVNDYLAQRDAGWMAELYYALGLSVGVIIPNATFIYDPEYSNDEHEDPRFRHLKPCTRQEGYNADITYGTNNEFGFDYLRDNISTTSKGQIRQRELNFAIVDEVDSILIDEARTPLIISAPASASGNNYGTFSQIVKRLGEGDYDLDEKDRTVSLTDDGIIKVQKWLGVQNLYSSENVHLIYHLEQSLKAQTLFKKDKDYVVAEDGEVVIVDEFTGRLMQGRRYSEGLHQAIEAKEGVDVQRESMTLATISFQNYFRLYSKLSGMTGTAATEADEFFEIYGLGVLEIPTNKPVARLDQIDRVFKTEAGKIKAVIAEVKRLQEKGQPVLLGSATIEKNEMLSQMLQKAGVTHEVLNAKNNEREASIVAQAGQKGSVTLATNIAGRGTDIVLGEGVKDLGGLFVLSSERHEARRIDNQLRGRSGRQGDPGESQFYVSAEDDLMRIFGGERLAGLMSKLGVDEDTPIENKSISKAIESAQKKVEGVNYDQRRNVVKYDDVMNRQRKATYTSRQNIIKSESIRDRIMEMIAAEANVLSVVDPKEASNYKSEITSNIPLKDSVIKKLKDAKDAAGRKELINDAAVKLYEEREKEFDEDRLREMEREVYLQILDVNWMQQLESLAHLRQGIGLRGIAQKDPVVEYRRESQEMYNEMRANVDGEVVKTLFKMKAPEVGVEGELGGTELTKLAQKSSEGAATAGDQKTSKKAGSANQPAGSRAQRRASAKKGSAQPSQAHPSEPHEHLPDGSIRLLDKKPGGVSVSSRVVTDGAQETTKPKITVSSKTLSGQSLEPVINTASASSTAVKGMTEEEKRAQKKKDREAAKKKKAKRKKGRR